MLLLSADFSLETSQPRVNRSSHELHDLQAMGQESSQPFLSVWVNTKFTAGKKSQH